VCLLAAPSGRFQKASNIIQDVVVVVAALTTSTKPERNTNSFRLLKDSCLLDKRIHLLILLILELVLERERERVVVVVKAWLGLGHLKVFSTFFFLLHL
jgi:hypothetical protein